MKELKGKCKNWLGCNKLNNPFFTGIYRCEYATSEQINIEKLKKELTNEQIQK